MGEQQGEPAHLPGAGPHGHQGIRKRHAQPIGHLSLEITSENRCCRSVTFAFGSGSGSCSFRQVAFKMPTKKSFFALLLFDGTFIPVFKDKKKL